MLEADRLYLEMTKRAMEEEARQARKEAELLSAAAAILVRPAARTVGVVHRHRREVNAWRRMRLDDGFLSLCHSVVLLQERRSPSLPLFLGSVDDTTPP